MRYIPSKKADFYRDFPYVAGRRRAVCKRCHVVMDDFEPMSPNGEYAHPTKDKNGKKRRCINVGQVYTQKDLEIEPFLRKGERARNKRNGVSI